MVDKYKSRQVNTKVLKSQQSRNSLSKYHQYAKNEEGERFNCLTEGINYEDVVENGWARASTNSKRRDFLNNGWGTPSGKIEIKCEAITEAYPNVSPFPEYVPEISGQYDPLKSKYPIQVLSSASHYFIGDSFQSVPRLQAMQSRPTVELSVGDAKERKIKDGDLVRLYNDQGSNTIFNFSFFRISNAKFYSRSRLHGLQSWNRLKRISYKIV
jgi:anaerobic selenocysteine-containing dehydrogenase